MSHIVQYLTYKGEKFPLRISYYCIKKFQEETKRDIGDIEKDLSLLEVLLWYGLEAGHKAENKEMKLKRDEMELILDESMNEFNELIISFFPLSPASSSNTGDVKKN